MTATQADDTIVTWSKTRGDAELYSGTDADINATDMGLTKVVDIGTGNTLDAGGATGIILAGGDADVLVGGSGSSTLLAMGDSDEVTTGAGSTSISIVGDSAIIDASLGASKIEIAGSDATVSCATKRTLLDVSGLGAQISGVDATLTLQDGVDAEIDGSGHTITAAGGDGTITLDASSSTLTTESQASVAVVGSHDTVTGSIGTTVSVSGADDAIATANGNITYQDGASGTVTGNGNIIVQMSNSSLTLTGINVAVEVAGTNAFDVISNSLILIDEDMAATIVTGSGNDIGVSAGGLLTDFGTNDTIDVSGTAACLKLNGSGANASMSNGSATIAAADSLNGSDNALTLDAGAQLTLTGSNNVTTISGSAGSISIFVGTQSLAQTSNGTLQLTGFDGSSAVTVTDGHAGVDFGNGNTLVADGFSGQIDGFDPSGHQLWSELYDRTSGALNETDQYSYNSSNMLTQVDKRDGSGHLTESDLYSPTRNIEVGSYIYGTPGQVTEVVDLVASQDWVRSANGLYTEKNSGATSGTQPVLNNA